MGWSVQAQHVPFGILQLGLGSRDKCPGLPKPFPNLSSAQEQLLEHSCYLVPVQADAKLASKYRGSRFFIGPVHTFNRGIKNRFPERELKWAGMARKQGRSRGQQMKL